MSANTASQGFEIERVTGASIESYIDALARLRIEVFREYPYLYEGTYEYESKYLYDYSQSARATLVIARVDGEVVGVATALPLLDHGDADVLAKPLRAHAIDPSHVYYFGESVLRRPYRGRGIGHAFFDHREESARALGFATAAFCAVDRSRHHPARPADYVPLDAFWQKRGFHKCSDLVAYFSWLDLGEATETKKPMIFWLKELTP